MQCPRGTYHAGQSAGNCTGCPLGTYQSMPGQSSCISCPDGTSTLPSKPGRKVSDCKGTYIVMMCLFDIYIYPWIFKRSALFQRFVGREQSPLRVWNRAPRVRLAHISPATGKKNATVVQAKSLPTTGDQNSPPCA